MSCRYVDVSDRQGKPHSLAVEILAQEETWNTPSILEAHNRKTGGRAIFSQVGNGTRETNFKEFEKTFAFKFQIHLELDPSQFQSNIDGADNSLHSSNQLRYEILSDLLGSRIGLKLKEKDGGSVDEQSIVYKNAYFLGKHEVSGGSYGEHGDAALVTPFALSLGKGPDAGVTEEHHEPSERDSDE